MTRTELANMLKKEIEWARTELLIVRHSESLQSLADSLLRYMERLYELLKEVSFS